jgi:hypothetical protein
MFVRRVCFRAVSLRPLLLLISCGLCVATLVDAQRAIQPRSFQALRDVLPQVSDMSGVLEVRLRWNPAARTQSGPPTTAAIFQSVRQRTQPGRLRRERRPELSADRLVVVLVDRDGREIDWRLTPNPRVLRGEVPGPDGQLTGRTYETNVAEFDIQIPDLPNTQRLHIYQPRWAQSEYVLELLGSVELRTR